MPFPYRKQRVRAPFSRPIQLQTIIKENTDITSKTRKFQIHFQKTNATVLGPDLSHRKTLVHKLLNKPKVLAAISQEVKDKNIPHSQVKKIALRYADEIAANMSYGTFLIYVFDLALE
jgi:glycerol-3-phosphate O-acyltransferase